MNHEYPIANQQEFGIYNGYWHLTQCSDNSPIWSRLNTGRFGFSLLPGEGSKGPEGEVARIRRDRD